MSQTHSILPFQLRDVHEMRLRAFDRTTTSWMGDDQHLAVFNGGPGFTLRVDGRIVVCAGILKYWPGRGEAWMLTTPLMERYPILCFRSVRDGMNRLIRELELRRLDAVTSASYRVAIRWLYRLGFVRESEMLRYGPDGETYVRFVMFPESK